MPFPTIRWPAAIELWEKASNLSKNQSTRFHAFNNIAIAYEIAGNLDKALFYASKAIETYPYIIVFSTSSAEEIFNMLEYYEVLKQRKEDAKLLDKQLNN